MRINLSSFLDDSERHADEVALVYRRGLRTFKWSYRRLRETAYQIARELESRGIEKGDRVLFWAENSAEWVAAFFGSLTRGAVAVPLDADSTSEFALRVQRQVEAKLLFNDRARPCPPEFTGSSIELEQLPELAARHSSSPVPSPAAPDDVAEIIFTSGTTAEPKGVCLTHRNLLANIGPIEREIQKYLRWERLVHPVRFLNLLPLSHVFGQFMGIFIPQLLGGEIHFFDSLNPGEVIERVRSHRISVIVTVPRLLESLRSKIERDAAAAGESESFAERLEHAETTGAAKRWWRFRKIHRQFGFKFWAFVCGGAALPARTESFWRRMGFAVVQGYGMTETASLVTVNHPFKVGRGSIGKAMPGQEIKLSETGEIMVRGANVSAGYWQGGVQPIAEEQGWLKTGDVAEVDAEGNLYFKGRSKDVIVTAAGMNIYPDDLEVALRTEPEIRDCTVVSIDGPQGPEPLAVLLLADRLVDVREVVARANHLLNPYQQIRRWVIWPEADLPRTTTGKTRKPAVLEKLHADGLLSQHKAGAVVGRGDDDGSPRDGRSSSVLIQEIARITGSVPNTVNPSANLATDLKLDSLGRVELLSALEDHYQVDLDEDAFTEATTLGEIEKLIRGESVVLGRPQGSGPAPDFSGGASFAGRQPGPQPISGAGATGDESRIYPRWQQARPIRILRLAVLYGLILPFTRAMGRATFTGRERLRDVEGPVLVVSNHVAMVDQALILQALPARLRNRTAIAMEGERLWRYRYSPSATGLFAKLLGFIKYVLVVALFNVFPLPQKSGFRRSFSFAGDCVDRGYSVLVFPEGRRTETGEMSRFMGGIGVLATGLQVPVIPVRLDGLYELKVRRKYFAKRGQIRVTVGEPTSFEFGADPARVTRELESLVKSVR